MSVQERDDPYSRSRPPVFTPGYEDSASGVRPLGHVHYEDDEQAPLLSQSASALTDGEVKKKLKGNLTEEEKKANKRRWRSVYVMYFTMFLTALTFSIVISSIWPYLLEVDYSHATPNFLGWVVACYSFGQLLASPLFGLWADKRPTREPMIVAFAMNIIFNLVYSYLGAFGNGVAGWVMIASRALVGFGGGIGAVTRSYVAEATSLDERTGAMAAINGAQALGFIVGPALGLAFVPLGSNGVAIKAIKFRLNMYTGPGFLAAIMALLNLLFFICFFREAKLVDRKTKKAKEKEMTKKKELAQENESIIPPPSEPKPQRFDIFAAVASIVIFFVILSAFSVFETVLSPLTMDEFAWTRKQAVLYVNVFFAGLSFITIATLIFVKVITKNDRVDERVVLMIGMFLLAFAFFTIIPMSNEPPKTLTMSTLSNADVVNATAIPNIPLINSNLTLDLVGCRDPPQEWCSHVPRIYFAQLIVSLLIVTPGYASTSLACFSIYSKVLGPVKQGVMMGLLTAAGSLARGLGPMTFSNLYQHFGPSVTFATIVGVIAITIIFILVCSPRLIPYERRMKKRLVVLT